MTLLQEFYSTILCTYFCYHSHLRHMELLFICESIIYFLPKMHSCKQNLRRVVDLWENVK